MACYQIVNDFKINLSARKKLGQGSQGSVYPGISLITNDDVAAKRTEGVYKENFNKEEFEKEAELLLNRIPPHENIIKVYDFTKTEYESKGIPMLDLWLITELCEFGNLKEFAFAHDLSTEQKIEIMYQSALAVRHLHGCKPESVAHRDVKPENILVTGSEDNPIIKLCDFGSAKSVNREGVKSVTMRSLAGTRRYQAPEQVELHGGQFKYNKQVDIFSLGVTFLALLNAVKGSLMSPETIDEKGLGEIMWMKHKQKQEFTFSVHKSSDSALVRAVKYVIENMIKFEPSSRLSAAEVVEALKTIGIEHNMQRQLAPATDTPSAPATDTPSAPATDTPSAPATDTPSAPATDTPSAPATDTPSAPATDTPSAPATDTPSAPATDIPSAPATDTPSAPATDTPSAPATDTPSAPVTNTPSAPATETWSPGTKVISMFAYQAKAADELSIQRNDVLTIIDMAVDPGWCLAKDTSGTIGMIPDNFVHRLRQSPIIDWIPGTKVVAMFDRETDEEDELSFQENDVLTITDMIDYQGWCFAKDTSGNIGMIPDNYVRRRREVQLQPMWRWYHGEMTWRQACALLTGEEIPEIMAVSDVQKLSSNKDVGTFLVHAVFDAATTVCAEYTLCVVSPYKHVEHYAILRQDGKLTIDEDVFFEDLPQLVQFYQRDAYGLCTNLQKPLAYNGPLSVYAHSRDFLKEGWSINLSEVDIREKCYSDRFADIHKGSYYGEDVYTMKRTENNPHNVQDVLIEAAIMSGLSHKNVVQLIGVVLGEENLIVTEYLSKGRLSDYLLARGPDTMSSHDQINIARDICQGMQYLELRNIVHNSLLAQSILLSKEGTAKIGHFHLSHQVEQKRSDTIPFRWTAPEVLSKERPTTKADMWSFGIVMWEIYSFGCKPYSKMSNLDVCAHVIKGGRLDAPKGCPAEMYRVMLTAWDDDPAKRPTFSELGRILDIIGK